MAQNICHPPVISRQLGYAGAVPFVVGAIAALPFSGIYRDYGIWLLLNYGAIIFSFMGGVHWGAAILRGDLGIKTLGCSVIPSLISLLAVCLGANAGLWLLLIGFVGLLYYDEFETKHGRVPNWYPSLRRPLTCIVVSCLAIGDISAIY